MNSEYQTHHPDPLLRIKTYVLIESSYIGPISYRSILYLKFISNMRVFKKKNQIPYIRGFAVYSEI